MAKTSKDVYRYIREWSNFFADVNSVASAEIEVFLRKRKRKQYFKQSLKRLKTRGFLAEKNKNLVPTRKGLIFFRRQNLLNDCQKPLSKWDGKWRLISFDVPVREEAKRQQLRNFLKEFDFYQLHKSVWVSPHKLAEDFWRLLVDYELDKYCKMMTVEIVKGGEELKNRFHLN